MEGQQFETNLRGKNEKSPEKLFHFKEIAEIEPAVVSLTEQLKEKIDAEEYDTLISDDVGGRIPTLILRKIIKARHPKNKLKTFFIASGKTHLPRPDRKKDYEKLESHLNKITKDTHKALLVTQFIHRGGTMESLSHALKNAGLENFDVAAVDVAFENQARSLIEPVLGDNKLFIGSQAHSAMHEEHEHLSGVRKIKKNGYSPYPRRAVDVIAQEGRELSMDEWREIFGIRMGEPYNEWKEKPNNPEKIKEFERRTNAPLTPEEKAKIQQNINLARADVNLLADRVVEKVWGKQEQGAGS